LFSFLKEKERNVKANARPTNEMEMIVNFFIAVVFFFSYDDGGIRIP
jgi:hypothetical protein